MNELTSMDEFWSMNEGTFYCLYDHKRSTAFKKAIKNTVKPGDVVVDLGSGSGVLAMFAADAGASVVYALELDSVNYNSLKETVKVNGYSDVIKVIQDDATTCVLPEKVDVVICELIATGLFEELQVPAMNNILKQTNKGFQSVIHFYDITIDLVKNRNLFYGKTFEVLRFEFPDLKSMRSDSYSETKIVKHLDFTKRNSKRIHKELKFKIKKSGEVNGIRVSGTTTFSDGSHFDSSISYSFPMILPTPTVAVTRGEVFTLKISYNLCEGPSTLRYKLTLDS